MGIISDFKKGLVKILEVFTPEYKEETKYLE